MTVIDHDVVRFDVSVHDAHTVAVVEGPQQLVQVVANVVVCQLLVQSLCNTHTYIRGELVRREGGKVKHMISKKQDVLGTSFARVTS